MTPCRLLFDRLGLAENLEVPFLRFKASHDWPIGTAPPPNPELGIRSERRPKNSRETIWVGGEAKDVYITRWQVKAQRRGASNMRIVFS